MELKQLEDIIRSKNSSGSVRRTIGLDQLSLDVLDHISNNRSEGVRTAVYSLHHNPYMVIVVRNNTSKRVLVLMDKVLNYYKSNYMYSALTKDRRLLMDIRNYGIASFDVSIAGLFPCLDSSLDYRDYLINKNLNSGVVVYNEETYNGSINRVLSVVIDNRLLSKLVAVCVGRDLSINVLVNKLIKRYLLKVK